LQFLDASWRSNHPRVVAEEALHFTQDRRDGITEEVVALGRVEAANRLDKPETGDLDKILYGNAPVAIPHDNGLGHFDVEQDDLFVQSLALGLIGVDCSDEQFVRAFGSVRTGGSRVYAIEVLR
jgi:hypothetical protein